MLPKSSKKKKTLYYWLNIIFALLTIFRFQVLSILALNTVFYMIRLFSLRVNTPLLAALLLEISFVEIPRSLLRGDSFN
jgi:hypothetical protein